MCDILLDLNSGRAFYLCVRFICVLGVFLFCERKFWWCVKFALVCFD